MGKQYFISYLYSETNDVKNSGFGSTTITTDGKIKSMDDIFKIQKQIEKNLNIKGVIIMNYREM